MDYSAAVERRWHTLSSNAKHETLRVCFCDIPVGDLGLHMRKYGEFGLAFAKENLIKKGAAPVFYISQQSLITNARYISLIPDSQQLITLKEAFDSYSRDWERCLGRMWTSRENREVAWFNDVLALQQKLHWLIFAQLKFFDVTKDDVDEANFYMEREWRLLGTVPFTLEEVTRVILPSSFAKRFRKDVSDYCGQVTFSD
jgi:Putative abortive phage resistance protein AbiGi, antitoxin